METNISNIIERREIELSPQQQKMIISGWSEETLEKSIVDRIVYLSDDIEVEGYIARPKDDNLGRKYPCIMWNRGGYKKSGRIDPFTAKGIYGQMASWGYMVFASSYRGSIEGKGEDEFGGAEVNDILNLMDIAEKIPEADTGRWAIEGWSRGGMMSFLTLLQRNDFRCALLISALSDLTSGERGVKKLVEIYKQSSEKKNLQNELKKRSAINFVDKLPADVHYMLIHGTDDNIVSPLQSVDISRKLLEREIHHRLVLMEKGDHFLKQHRKEVDALRKRWYFKYLD